MDSLAKMPLRYDIQSHIQKAQCTPADDILRLFIFLTAACSVFGKTRCPRRATGRVGPGPTVTARREKKDCSGRGRRMVRSSLEDTSWKGANHPSVAVTTFAAQLEDDKEGNGEVPRRQLGKEKWSHSYDVPPSGRWDGRRCPGHADDHRNFVYESGPRDAFCFAARRETSSGTNLKKNPVLKWHIKRRRNSNGKLHGSLIPLGDRIPYFTARRQPGHPAWRKRQ